MSEATFWFTTVITVIILMIPVLAWRFYFVDVCPTLSDRVRLKQRLAQLRYVGSLLLVTAPRSGKKVPLLIHIFVHIQCFKMLNTTAFESRDKELPAVTGRVLSVPDSNI